MALNIKVVSFYTEGAPFDDGLSLSDCGEELRSVVTSQGAAFEAYTPRRLQALGADILTKRFDDVYKLVRNPGYHTVGMGAWKPFVMLHALQNMDRDGVVIYTDANVRRYPGLASAAEDISTLASRGLGEYDFFIGREAPDQRRRAAQFSSARQLFSIGNNTIFSCNFPIHIANRLMVRNTPLAREILVLWLALCMQESLILPPVGNQAVHPEFLWFCAEQSVLNMIIANYVEEGILPYYYPGRGFERDGTLFKADSTHCSMLLPPSERESYIPLKMRFAKEIATAQLFMAGIQEEQAIEKAA